MLFLLAQDAPINPAKVAEELGKAESTEEVLAIVVGVLLLFLLVVVVFHVREARRWEGKVDALSTKNLKTWRRVERAISALAGLPDTRDDDDDEED